LSDRQRRAQATASARGKGNGNSKDMETATFSAVWQKAPKAKHILEIFREIKP
jgi:transposase-like protein